MVRSGRSEVVVVGRGPVATALVASGGPGARILEDVPEDAGRELEGADAVVLVAHPGDLSELAGSTGVPVRDRRASAVARARRVLEGARAAGVPHVVVVSSATVHGAWAQRPPIGDDEPVPPPEEAQEGLVGDLQAVEAELQRGRRRRTPVLTVLRPAPLVGPGVDTMVTRHFEAPRLLTVRGAVREWQFLHLDDLVSAVRLVLAQRLGGTFTAGAADVLSPERVEQMSGMRRIELAAVTAFGTAERLHRVGALPAPSSELAYVVYPWTVTSEGLRAAGWEPHRSSEECLQELLDQVRGRLGVGGRRLGTRDAAALGAAGAAVALIGTAAVWRQARARRRG
ncbi:NAD-dependent epimerase/dehydratase family protein [Cellulomonas soli]|uniref:NAD-dependent epimerase/dehydratase family protein n=1 Tax=Cellulomonas soli TaxID=931535 RepID=UPI0017C2D6A1|nr:NAD-dependent epimerase/dehydratase family protein [Cellulomonas soli]NYI57758.1 nucleoside-diphosphate-sugar epimerase [Cellulomonas soli]